MSEFTKWPKIFMDEIERIYTLCGYLESEKLEGRKALYQAISRGFFSYEDFITITEFTPHITTEIAKGMGRTVNEIRIMTQENNLTIEDVLISIENRRKE